jgi:transcriptional regulator with XRE-family HTH domain
LVARLAGLHVNVIGRTERGTYNPTILTLDAIATALDTSLADLLPDAAPKRRRRSP